MDIAPGTEIRGTVRLIRPLGHGGMGSVWLAEHLTLRAPVAVKLMSSRAAGDERAVARFAAEAAAAARLRGPHVVEVLDYGVVEGTPFIVMERLLGEDLQTRLAREGRMTAQAVLPIVRGVCQALDRAHALGVVHRDIKPGNLYLVDSADGPVAKVLDFGLAKMDDGADGPPTASGSVFGTLAYLSPEQAESSRRASPRSDLWSLGVVVYRCLTGSLPFSDESLMGMCIAIDQARFKRPSAVNPELSPSLDAWLTRALQREPCDRFASAGQMAEAFARAVDGVQAPVDLEASGTARRRRSRAGVMAVATMAVLAAAGASWLERGLSAGSESSTAAAASAGQRLTAAGSRIARAPAELVLPSVEPSSATGAAVIAVAGRNEPSRTPPAPVSSPATPPTEPAPPSRVRVTTVTTHDLYPPSYVVSSLAAHAPAFERCFVPAGATAPLATFQMYEVDVTAAGAITAMRHPGDGGPAALDACMNDALRALALRPTDGGRAGPMIVGLTAR